MLFSLFKTTTMAHNFPHLISLLYFNVSPYFSPWWILAWFFISFFLAIVFFRFREQRQRSFQIINKQNMDTKEEDELSYFLSAETEVIMASFYLGGHPAIKKLLSPCLLINSENNINIAEYDKETDNTVKNIGTIPKYGIQNIELLSFSDIKFKLESKFMERTLLYLHNLELKHIHNLAFISINIKIDGSYQKIIFGIFCEDPMMKALFIRNKVFGWRKVVHATRSLSSEENRSLVEESLVLQPK
jgi:hypothetical protein